MVQSSPKVTRSHTLSRTVLSRTLEYRPKESVLRPRMGSIMPTSALLTCHSLNWRPRGKYRAWKLHNLDKNPVSLLHQRMKKHHCLHTSFKHCQTELQNCKLRGSTCNVFMELIVLLNTGGPALHLTV